MPPGFPRQFLDVPWLLQASEPRRPMSKTWLLLLGVGIVVMFSTLAGGQSGAAGAVLNALSGLAVAGLMGGLVMFSVATVKRVRAEHQAVESIGEMIQLRRWPEAGAELDRYLSSPARSHGLRAQALVYLGAVLARYQRFDDALAVYDNLLDSDMLEPGSAYGLRLGRAMAMLREDHLVDADRALGELRRLSPSGVDSAGLALLELYRDVKTGHFVEAIQRFERSKNALRDQLGHRSADAWALLARAYDALERPAEAQQAYRNATLLAPPVELTRRYPEVAKLDGKYEPAYAPAEAA